MTQPFSLRTGVQLGVVPTHIKFVGGLVPDGEGRLPRGDDGRLIVVSEMAAICEASPVPVQNAQITIFPGTHEADTDEMFGGLRDLGLGLHPIMMVGGADPMDPADEEKVAAMLPAGLKVAIKHGITQVASTSIEPSIHPGAPPKPGEAFAAAVAQNVRSPLPAYPQAGPHGM